MKLLAVIFLCVCAACVPAQEKGLDFEEVFNLIRTNVADLSEAELRQNAAVGLIKEMGTRVQIVTTNAEAADRPPDAITRRSVFENEFGYIRVRAVDERLPSDFGKSLGGLMQSNKLSGIILDLRYAEGTEYEAAAQVAERFVARGQPILALGERQIQSMSQVPPVKLPLVMLVNSETRAAAEAIAAALREAASAIVIGERTTGEARLFEIFTLSNGQKLRIAKVPIKVGGGKVIPATGIEPDIAVTIDPEEERLFYQDPYRQRRLTTRSTAGGGRGRRLNEAELVRQHREGFDFSEEQEAETTTQSTVVNDPALSRAIDFLKGISKMKARPPL